MSWRLYKNNTDYIQPSFIFDDYGTYNPSTSILEHSTGVAQLWDGYPAPHTITLKFHTTGDGKQLWKTIRDYIANGTQLELSLRFPYGGNYDIPVFGASGWYQFLYPRFGQVVMEHLNEPGIGSVVTTTFYPMLGLIMRRDTGGIFNPTNFIYAMPPW